MDQSIRGLEEIQEKSDILSRELEKWFQTRENTINIIKNILTELAEHHRNVKIASITGGSVSLVGYILSTIGAVMLFTPVAAAGLGLLIAGGVVAGAGGVTSAGANITKLIIEKLKKRDIRQKIETDAEQLEKIREIISKVDELITEMQDLSDAGALRSAIQNVPPSIKNLIQLSSNGFTGITAAFLLLGRTVPFDDIGQVAVKTLAYSTRLAVGKVSLGAIGLILSVIEIGYYAHGLRKQTKSVTEKQLMEWLTQLEKELESFREFSNVYLKDLD